MHDTIDADADERRRDWPFPSPGQPGSNTRSKRRANGSWRASTRRATGAASSTVTRRSRATRSCSRPSWAAGTAKNQRRLARTIRDRALPGGGWSQYPGGPADLSVSCLSYFALKVVGDDADAPHMRGARDAILAMGGADRANTYTRYHLALFGQYPWGALPGDPARDDLPARPWRRSASTTCRAGRGRSSSRCRSCGRRSPCACCPTRAAPGSCFAARPAAMRRPRRVRRGARSSPASTARSRSGERLPGAGRAAARAPSSARPPG